MNYAQLLEEVKQEVTRFFYAHENSHFSYHNLSHTQRVVANAAQIAQHYQLNDRDFFIVATAAWYHDVGYYLNDFEEHEKRGMEAAEKFLRTKDIDDETIHAIQQCILATRIPQNPQTLLEQIVCDADLFHFGTDEFSAQNKLMRKEASWRKGKEIDKAFWRRATILLLEAHEFKTDYAKELLTGKKQENVQKLLKKQHDAEHKSEPEKVKPKKEKNAVIEETGFISPQISGVTESTPKNIIEKKKKNPDRPERGIETMFRISSNNHQRLSDMADNKANIMITTTSIILSVLLSIMLRKLEDNQHLVIPTVLLLLTCVITMVFSILATRPSLPAGMFTQSDLDTKKVNLLFFGNFYRMSYEDYDNGMQQVMNDRDFLYGSLTRDVYSQGIVLGRKYRLLRAGYNVFMYGVIISVLAYMIAAIFFKH